MAMALSTSSKAVSVSPSSAATAVGSVRGPARSSEGTVTVVPLLPIAPADPRRAIDGAEWVLARALHRSPRLPRSGGAGSRLKVLSAALRERGDLYPFLERGAASERARWDERRFGPYDGLLAGEAAANA